jgi:hypothetical protein
MIARHLVAALIQGPPDSFIPQGVVDIVQSFFLTIGLIALGVPIIRAISRRWERGSSVPTLPPDLTHRLERIEQAVEAVAIEVERMAEAQRFTAKLMAEQRSLPPGEPAAAVSKATARESELRPPERGR